MRTPPTTLAGLCSAAALAVALLLTGCDAADSSTAQTQPADATTTQSRADTTRAAGATATTPTPEQAPMVQAHVFNDAGELVGPVEVPKVVKTDAQWRLELGPEQYRILRNAGTEAAFCGTLLDNKKQGVYACAGCGLPLFSSDSKFDSGTGWPSFFQPVAKDNIIEKVDRSHGMVRTEILCARCDGHLGHVFEDGPRPTGLRYCLNSESLTFTESSDLASLADAAVE